VNQNYLKEFQRWTAGPQKRREALSAEFAEHLSEADAAGELGSTLERLGPPRDAAKAFAAGHALRPAPLGRRIAAALLDFGIPFLLALAVIAAGTFLGSGARQDLLEFGRDVVAERQPVFGVLQSIAAFLLMSALLWWLVGITVAEWRFGRGPGKALLGLRVVTEDGIAPSFGQVVVRRLTLVFSGPLQLIDWAFALFDPRRQRAVEKLAHTMVIHDETPEPLRTADMQQVGLTNLV
jgi:uncharacterized RDD family membrane protein YckC